MKSVVFAVNLRREIKKQGYKTVDFVKDVLKMSYPTFSDRCKNGSFTINEVFIIEDELNTTFELLCIEHKNVGYKAKKIVQRSKQLKNKIEQAKKTNEKPKLSKKAQKVNKVSEAIDKEIKHGSKYSNLSKYL